MYVGPSCAVACVYVGSPSGVFIGVYVPSGGCGLLGGPVDATS